jgi:hypothetical protein
MKNANEVNLMVSQNVIPSRQLLGGSHPYVFTEHGALMLASVLNSDRAITVGVLVVRTFVKMRELISTHKDLNQRLDEMETKYEAQFKVVFDALRRLINPPEKDKKIGFLRGGDA